MGVATSHPYQLSIAEAAREIGNGRLSPVELMRSVLERINKVEPLLSAFVTVTAETALERARLAERGLTRARRLGALHGIPVAVKDLFETKGVVTTSGSRVRAGLIPRRDAACVERLKRAGGILIGKTNTDEFAYGMTCPPTRNPWDTDRVPGGSSGGSAVAVAAGEAFTALGTDTGGSIRCPASLCGVVGLKPTYGRVSMYGVTPLSWSLDHAGPLTRTVRDAAIVLNSIAGHDSRDPASARVPVPDFTEDLESGLAGLTLGVPSNHFFEHVQPEVEAAVRGGVEVLRSLGASVREVEVPLADIIPAVELGIVAPEASAYHRRMLRERADDYGPRARLLLEAGELVLATDYLAALRSRRHVQTAWREVFQQVDALVTPTVPVVAALVGQSRFTWPGGMDESLVDAYIRFCCPANVTGLPALSVPCGFDGDGLPIGMQLIGRPFDELTILRIGYGFESATIRPQMPEVAA